MCTRYSLKLNNRLMTVRLKVGWKLVQGGFIWLFYGPKSLPEEERPPIPYVPELDDPSWQPVYGDIEFECNHW